MARDFNGGSEVNLATRLSVLISPSCPLPAAGLHSALPGNPECQACDWGDDLRREYGSLRACGANIVMSNADQACRLLSACIACRASGKSTAPRLLLVTTAEPDASARPVITESAPGSTSTQAADAGLLDAIRNLMEKAQPVPPQSGGIARGGMGFGSLRRTREHIERRLAHRISLPELAAIAGLSAGHFSRAFKQSVGMSPHRYLLKRRIAAAAELIRNTERPLAEVALSVGFCDQSHFTRVFAREWGDTPSAFRRRYR
jgi:AraC-like DNA-binding protein